MKNCLIASLMLCAFALSAQTTSVTTVQETKQIVEREKEGKKWTLTLKNYEVESLLLNGKTVPAHDYAKYQNVIDALRAAANGYEMPSETVVTSKGIPSTTSAYEYSETRTLTPAQKYLHQKMEEALKNDKILNSDTKSLQFVLTEKSMTINGTEMSKELTDKYIALYDTHSSTKRCAGCTFMLSFNHVAATSAGW